LAKHSLNIRKRFMSLSLRTHLLIMAALLSFPAFILSTHFAFHQGHDAIENGKITAQKIVYSVASEQHNLAGDAEQLLTILAQLPDVKNHNVSATNAILADILKKSPQYGNIVVLDREGTAWASGLPIIAPFSLKNGLTFNKTVNNRQFSSGEYNIGKISGRPTIGFGYPIIDNEGTLRGVIAVNLNFNHFNELVKRAGLPNKSIFILADHNGIILDRNHEPERYVGHKENDDVLLRLINGSDEGSSVDYGPARSIEAYQKMRLPNEGAPYLYIRASIPLKEILHTEYMTVIYYSAVFVPFLVALFTLVVYIGNTCFIKRIKMLQDVTTRFSEGDRHIKAAELIQGGELGRLGLAFDQMANKLASRELSLVTKQQELNDLNFNLTLKVEEETEKRLHQERLMARHARLAAIGEMIGAIAHQWRQPLATVGATIQSIRMAWDLRRIDDAFLKHAEADAQKQLNYMSDTIEDFRNFFSPDKVVEQFDVKEKITEVTHLVAAQFANSGVCLEEVETSPDFQLTIEGYQNEFKQSLLNLVSNAFDAIMETRKPGQDTAGKVTISAGKENDSVVIEVSDNGCGIPDDIAGKIFEPYFTSKSEGKGTGIGLYMAKLIIEESMGGKLSFTSGPDGTVFKITLARDLSFEGDRQ